MDATEETIRQVLETYRAAVWAKDVEAFVNLYDPNVRVFDLWGEWTYAGAAAWRGMVVGWFGSLGTERVAVGFEGVELHATPGLATLQAFVTYQGVSAEGAKLRAMTNRLTWVLKPQGAAWKVLHEHSSSPVDFQTMKPQFQRPGAAP